MAGNKVLQGKTALVSGGSGAIGGACARFLAEDGAAVMLMGRREDALVKARQKLLELAPGARVETFAGDACDEDTVKTAAAHARAMTGRLDIIAATVGGCNFRPLLLQDKATFMQEYEMNVLSAFYMVKHGVPLMEPGGSIVCISSAAAVLPYVGLGAYGAAKAALEMFVRVVADEVSGAKIRVNAVRPGLTRAGGTVDFYANKELLDRFITKIPLGRGGEPEDIGRVARFLAGPESGWVTGQCFASDGGQELRGFPDQSDIIDAVFGKETMAKVRAGKPPR